MDLLFQGYSALRGDKGTPQSGGETVDKLCDRVANSTLLEDRRASVMGLKGLARDWKLVRKFLGALEMKVYLIKKC